RPPASSWRDSGRRDHGPGRAATTLEAALSRVRQGVRGNRGGSQCLAPPRGVDAAEYRAPDTPVARGGRPLLPPPVAVHAVPERPRARGRDLPGGPGRPPLHGLP